MGRTRTAIAIVVGVTSLLPTLAAANPIGVVKESGKTAAYATVDGVETIGRTVGDFFVHGPRTAKHTWNTYAGRTKADARAGKLRIAREAHDER